MHNNKHFNIMVNIASNICKLPALLHDAILIRSLAVEHAGNGFQDNI